MCPAKTALKAGTKVIIGECSAPGRIGGLEAYDVTAITASFGGGHQNTAGFSAGGTISNINSRIIKRFVRVFHQ
ncbi:MAG: hypothetical protein LBK62_10965 [Treponema sp.]|jgi:hypothetical protein|nr:hypothetical protein [Treponema sp.]